MSSGGWMPRVLYGGRCITGVAILPDATTGLNDSDKDCRNLTGVAGRSSDPVNKYVPVAMLV